MKKFLTLFWMQLNINFGFSALRFRFRKERDKVPQTLLVGAAIGITAFGLISMYSLLMSSVYQAGLASGRPEIVLVMSILGLQMFLLVTGVFYVIGVFYYSKDMASLMPMPLRPWQVLGSKFAVVMAYEYLLALPILLPPVIIYGVGQASGLFFWLKAVVLVAISPAIPMLLSSVAALGLMRLMNLGRRKDLFAILGSGLVTVAIIGFNLFAQQFAAASPDASALAELLNQQARFINTAGAAFPPSAWATLALTQSGAESVLFLLLYIAVSVALGAVLLLLSERFYYRSAVLLEETERKRRPTANTRVVNEAPVFGPVRSLLFRELRLLLRTPAFAMNCLLASLLLPVLLMMSMTQGADAVTGIRTLINDPSNSLLVTLGAVALMSLVSVVNVTASTSLSREGRTFWVSRMIPVLPRQQIYAKFLAAYTMAAAGLMLTTVLMVAFLHMSPYRCALALAIGLLGAIPCTITNMLPDLIRPKLNWTNPYEAVKQNLNVMISMVACAVVLGVEVLVAVVLVLLKLPEWLVYALLAALMAAQSLAGVKALDIASIRYYRIDG